MIPFALLICFFCISESQYIDSVPEELKAELELQMYTEDMGANGTLGNNQVVFFHHLIVYGEKKMDKHNVRYYAADCWLGFRNNEGVLDSSGYDDFGKKYIVVNTADNSGKLSIKSVETVYYDDGSRNKHFPWYLLLYDKVFNPTLDFEKCYEADREKALEMIE